MFTKIYLKVAKHKNHLFLKVNKIFTYEVTLCFVFVYKYGLLDIQEIGLSSNHRLKE